MMYAGGPGGDFLNFGIGGPSQGLMGNVMQHPAMGLMGQNQLPGQMVASGPRDAQGVPLSLYSPWNSAGNAVNPGMQHAPNLLQNLNQNTQGGPWSQLAYQMAGRPNQGPYAGVATPQGVPDASAGSSSGVGAIGGTALGLLGSLANNPSAAKSLGNLGSTAVSKLGGLFGSGALDTAGIGSAASAAAAEMGANVAPAVSAGLANTAGDVAAANSAWLAAQPAAASAAGAGLGAGAGLADVTGSLGAGLDAAAASSSAAVGGSGAGAAGSGAAGGSGVGSALAAAAPYAAAALAVAAPFYGLFAPSVTYDKSWWQGMENKVKAGGQTSPEGMQLATMMAQGDQQAIAMGQKYGIKPLTPQDLSGLPTLGRGGSGGVRSLNKA